MYKRAVSARDQHVLSFSYWAHHFLAVFSKVQEFVQNSLFSPRSAHFVIFALGTPLFRDFQQSAHVCTKQKFSARDQNVLSFSHWAHHILAIFSKVDEFAQNSVFSPRVARFVFFALGAQPFSDFQQNERVCSKHSFQPDIRRFAIFALCTPLFSNFPQSARVFAN